MGGARPQSETEDTERRIPTRVRMRYVRQRCGPADMPPKQRPWNGHSHESVGAWILY